MTNLVKSQAVNNKTVIDILQSAQKIIITTHFNPDGDAIGSCIALYDYLKALGKQVSIILPGPISTNLEFFNTNSSIQVFNDKNKIEFLKTDLLVILDLNDPRRIAPIDELLDSIPAKILLIDHHLEPKDFSHYHFIDSDSSSTGELVWRVLSSNPNFVMSKVIAQGLYTAIMTDTGSFRFPRTSSEVHRIIASLIDAGADPVYLYDMVYNQFPVSALRLKGFAYSKLEIIRNGLVGIITLTRNDFNNANAIEDETEGLVESILFVSGIKVGILIMESPDREEIRLSFRSKGEYSVRNMAVEMGGGGHAQASGSRIKSENIEVVYNKVIELIEKFII